MINPVAAAPPEHHDVPATEAPSSARLHAHIVDAEAICDAYSRRPETLPPSVQDLAPVYLALHKASLLPAGPTQTEALESIAQWIAYRPYLHLPSDPDIWRLAQAKRESLYKLLDGRHLRTPRLTGVQHALDEFAVRLDDLLTLDRGEGCGPRTLRKSVPLAHGLSVSSCIDVGITLDGVKLLASVPIATTRTAAASSSHHDLSPQPQPQPPLSIKSIADGFRLKTHPQAAHQLQAGDPARAALNGLHAELLSACRQGESLTVALSRFNLGVDDAFRLRLSPQLPPQAATAPMKGGPAVRHERQLWFDYAHLAALGPLDDLVDEPMAQARLRSCRAVALVAVQRELGEMRAAPLSSQVFRVALVTGCAVQLCIESTQLPHQPGMRFQFRVPVSEVMLRMTPTEKTFMQGLIRRLNTDMATLKVSFIGSADPGQGTRTYLSLYDGDPMGCVMLQQSGGASPGPKLSPRAGPPRYAQVPWDRVYSKVLEQRRPPPDLQCFDELRPSRLQPAWPGMLAREPAQHRLVTTVGPGPGPGLNLNPDPDLDDERDSGDDLDIHNDTHLDIHLDASAPPSPASDRSSDDEDTFLAPFLADLREPGHWTRFSQELAPHCLTDSPGWPAGRTLDIHHADNGVLLHRSGDPAATLAPVRIAWMPHKPLYSAVVGEQLLDIPADGDSFYAAVLAALPREDRLALLQRCGCPPASTEVVRSATLALREHLAQQLDRHRADYRERLLQLHGLLG